MSSTVRGRRLDIEEQSSTANNIIIFRSSNAHNSDTEVIEQQLPITVTHERVRRKVKITNAHVKVHVNAHVNATPKEMPAMPTIESLIEVDVQKKVNEVSEVGKRNQKAYEWLQQEKLEVTSEGYST